MLRTAATALTVLKRRGPIWPLKLLITATGCRVKGMPRGIMVEPTQGCTGHCTGCVRPEVPAVMAPTLLEEWLDSAPSKPVTVHFTGRHSDPLASPLLQELVAAAAERCMMTSISTIGLGLTGGIAGMKVDRWIVSIPAATEASWKPLRDRDSFDDVMDAIDTLRRRSPAMVEVVLTLWKSSERDGEAFEELAVLNGWKRRQVVFGRYDPEGQSIGRVENLALGHPSSPYTLSPEGRPVLVREPRGCPLAGCVFLTAGGTLLPCPFLTGDGPREDRPSEEAWRRASGWREAKDSRSFAACRFCP
ncbi:MAG: hypothetical protein AVO35_11345 [Candidatus Aegiribacteria sp. MLS_C]|nr:MAG: hypothetical protein AVO35_11345 [Candidatus Aegiribacteria sp. MLS_C]